MVCSFKLVFDEYKCFVRRVLTDDVRAERTNPFLLSHQFEVHPERIGKQIGLESQLMGHLSERDAQGLVEGSDLAKRILIPASDDVDDEFDRVHRREPRVKADRPRRLVVAHI